MRARNLLKADEGVKRADEDDNNDGSTGSGSGSDGGGGGDSWYGVFRDCRTGDSRVMSVWVRIHGCILQYN